MISLTWKIALLGVVGTSVIGGTTYWFLSKDKEIISENSKITKQKVKLLLESKTKSILSKTGNDQKWTKNWNKFKADYQSNLDKTFWNFSETSNLSATTDVPQNFKDKCESSKELEIEDGNKLFGEILLYCTDNGQ